MLRRITNEVLPAITIILAMAFILAITFARFIPHIN